MKALVTVLLATAFIFHAVCANGCTCGGVWNGCTVLKPEGDAVFLGTVISKQLGENPVVNGAVSSVVPSVVRFSIMESYKGISTNEVEVSTTEGCCACGYPFQVGHEYLVYANYHEGKLTTSICTATQPAVTAGAIIQQLRAVKAGTAAASIFGEVTRVPQDARIEGREKYAPVVGMKIRVLGSSGTELVTESDAAGAYEFRGLPPDTYEIQPLLPPGLNTREQLKKEPVKVVVEGGKGCPRDIWIFADGRITGRTITSTGQPVPGFVTVEPADPTERKAAFQRGGLPGFDTGPDARFELNLLWPGRYRLRFTPKVGGQIDFRKVFYFPRVIELSEGQHVDDLLFVVTPSD